jgi:hypothetical protein
VSGGQEKGQDQACGGYPPGDIVAARLFLQAFGQALPAHFLVFKALFRQGVGRCQSSPPGHKFIGFFV